MVLAALKAPIVTVPVVLEIIPPKFVRPVGVPTVANKILLVGSEFPIVLLVTLKAAPPVKLIPVKLKAEVAIPDVEILCMILFWILIVPEAEPILIPYIVPPVVVVAEKVIGNVADPMELAVVLPIFTVPLTTWMPVNSVANEVVEVEKVIAAILFP